MEFIRDIHARKAAAGQPVLSFEFFPPKTDEGDRTLLENTLPALKAVLPDYCSVTYGAGGGTREKTLRIVDRIQREHGLTTMCHLTCVQATVEELRGVDFILTQLFFANGDFLRCRDYLWKRAVTVPLCPGIIPILSAHQIQRFTPPCGAALPPLCWPALKNTGMTTRAARNSVSNTPPDNAPDCWARACRACTFTP